MTDKSGPQGTTSKTIEAAESSAAEAKRLAARRRFLLGGAAAVPLVITLGQKEAWAASANVCRSLNMSYDQDYVENTIKEKLENEQTNGDSAQDNGSSDPGTNSNDSNTSNEQLAGLAASLYCDPLTRWGKNWG